MEVSPQDAKPKPEKKESADLRDARKGKMKRRRRLRKWSPNHLCYLELTLTSSRSPTKPRMHEASPSNSLQG